MPHISQTAPSSYWSPEKGRTDIEEGEEFEVVIIGPGSD
jgi:hypothetical protein